MKHIGDMTRGQSRIDWREVLVRYLIAGSTNGQKQHEIMRRLAAYAKVSLVVSELESLEAEDKVQRFIVPTGMKGAPATVWRATTKILED